MKTVCFSVFFLIFFCPSLFAHEWKEIRAEHFIVYYDGDEDIAKEAARKADHYYVQIAADLGYPRYSNFWQWDTRCKVYLYSSEETFRQLTGQPGWSEGMASYSKKEIHIFTGEEKFTESILPHEITHLVFRDFVGLEGEIPIWMDEGVAQWEEPAKRSLAKRITRYLISSNKDYNVQDLTATDVRKLTSEEKVHNFYMQSVSLVDFLIQTYGGQPFTEFCRGLRDGKKFDDALRAAYPNTIESVGDLDARWRKYASEE